MARRLCDSLCALGVEAEVGSSWSPAVDINHFMMFHFAEAQQGAVSTMFITHVDDPLKVTMIRDRLAGNVDLGVCMSRGTVRALIAEGVPREGLCYISPAHDGIITPRRVRVGITTNLYPDGRKREGFLARLASELNLEFFHFEIFGKGWEKTAAQLRAGGASVRVVAGTDDCIADYEHIKQAIGEFDYYLYLGLDEGSLGTLDALAAGVKTIVTPQGFHLDIPGGITHPFTSYEELLGVFRELIRERGGRVESVSGWTWENYARHHVMVWRALLDGGRASVAQIPSQSLEASEGSADVPVRRLPGVNVGGYLRLLNRYRWHMFKSYYMPKVRRKCFAAFSRVGRLFSKRR